MTCMEYYQYFKTCGLLQKDILKDKYFSWVYRPGLKDLNQEVNVEVWNVGLAENPNGITFSWIKNIEALFRKTNNF